MATLYRIRARIVNIEVRVVQIDQDSSSAQRW